MSTSFLRNKKITAKSIDDKTEVPLSRYAYRGACKILAPSIVSIHVNNSKKKNNF